MREIPFVAYEHEVREILRSGRIQFRRVFKPQPELITAGGAWRYDGEIFVGDDAMQSYLFHDVYGNGLSPYGAVYGDGTADRLRVKETWATAATFDGQKPSSIPAGQHVWYSVDDDSHFIVSAGHWRGKARQSNHMPQWASRVMLGVTDVRIERVQDISAEDAAAEGVRLILSEQIAGQWLPVTMFRKLWDSINAKRGYSWESNPWVWVTEATRI